MDNPTMGQIICKYRKQKGLTQKALAEQLNITDKAVSKWERDIARPGIDIIPNIAKILEIPVDVLLNVSVDDTNSQTLQHEKDEHIKEVPSSNGSKEDVWDPTLEFH